MENQELFDNYIKGLLSETEKSDFESRLNTDKTLSSEFKTYLFVVKGIQKEEQQDCADFGAAMKKLTKEQLNEIIGTNFKNTIAAEIEERMRAEIEERMRAERICAERKIRAYESLIPFPTREEKMLEFIEKYNNQSEPKKKKLSPWLWSSMSAAAVVAIVVMISFNMIKQSHMDLNNAQYMAYNIIAEHNFDDGGFRGGANLVIKDFSAISEEELKEKLPLYETAYQQVQDELIGLNLAMIYLKLHNKDKALEILKELNAIYPECEYGFQDIINQIEKVGNKQ